MASTQFFQLIAILAILAPSILAAKVIQVGDDKGWTINFDYQAWAKGNEFVVGDQLGAVFIYPKGNHNVIKVDGSSFQQCTAPANAEPLTTGNDMINLTSSGKKWYICGISTHCESGNQKLAITVATESSNSSPPSAAMGISVMFLAILGIVMMMMV